jgi:hypothetical protein
MFVLCVLYSKDKRHGQDNQDEELVQMKVQRTKRIPCSKASVAISAPNPVFCLQA